MTAAPHTTGKKPGIRETYSTMTHDLDWDTSYQPMEKVFPFGRFEGIKIHDWAGWEAPFLLTIDAYWKFQGEKERKLYAIIDAFQQNNGQFNVTDARYINALKLFFTGISPLEYAAHRGFAFAGRNLRGAGARVACQMQSIDELRHAQTQIHNISQYNKFFNGFHDFKHMHERVWYLSVPRSYLEDAMSAGPFEFITAISFSFEYVLNNLLFIPFMSGAAYNGDLATVTFGFSAQSDESRHMALGLEVVKFMLEQDPDNLPIVQKWTDKWFWRGYRLLTLVSMMMDYMLPKRVMSWQEAWEIYFEQNGGLLFSDLERYGVRLPKYHDVAAFEKTHLSHIAWGIFYNYSHIAAIHTWIPKEDEMRWLAGKYPDSFDRYYRPRYAFWDKQQKAGQRFYNMGLPMLCQICQIPMAFYEPGQPGKICYRESDYRGNRFHFCSDGCKDIFNNEPEKYSQAWLPVQQILQGNCGGASIPEVLAWYHIKEGQDNGDFADSPDKANWEKWVSDTAA